MEERVRRWKEAVSGESVSLSSSWSPSASSHALSALGVIWSSSSNLASVMFLQKRRELSVFNIAFRAETLQHHVQSPKRWRSSYVAVLVVCFPRD